MKKLTIVLLIFIGLLSYAFGVEKPQTGGVEKPQTEQDTCITEECHAEHTSKPIIHDLSLIHI